MRKGLRGELNFFGALDTKLLEARGVKRQSAVGSNISQTCSASQTNIATQIIQPSARQSDARFSILAPPRDFTGRAEEIETLVNALTQGPGSDVIIASITGVICYKYFRNHSAAKSATRSNAPGS